VEFFDANTIQPTDALSHDISCTPDLTQALTVGHVVHGMDPLQAVLEAQLQAPLIQPLLF
jgi:hypothetical protein